MSPGCLVDTGQTSITNEGHIQFTGLSSVHPGQMATEMNFKFHKGLKGIKIILAPCNVIILDKLDKTVKIDIFIKVISRDIHSITDARK